MLRLFFSIFMLAGACAVRMPERAAAIPGQNEVSAPTPVVKLKPRLPRQADGSYAIPTLYWANPRPILKEGWHAVFGGTVVKVKKEKEVLGGDFPREFVGGKLKVEKIFLNFPEISDISIGSVIGSEDFDGLKEGDKVIIFINLFYEGAFSRCEIEGTNSKLGFKIKDWNEPIVSALEKTAPCNTIEEVRAEGHPENSRLGMYDCFAERSRMILDDPQISEIWQQYDPKGFQFLIEMRELEAAEQ